jgi:hypothetical protein
MIDISFTNGEWVKCTISSFEEKPGTSSTSWGHQAGTLLTTLKFEDFNLIDLIGHLLRNRVPPFF